MAHPATLAREPVLDQAGSWLARFSPLLDDLSKLGELTATDVEERIATLKELDQAAPGLRANLARVVQPEDQTLYDTFESSAYEVKNLEALFRRRLNHLAPGHFEARVDLDGLRERLAKVQAAREVGVWTGLTADQPSAHIRLRTGRPSPLGFLFLALFGLGWTSFTTFHAFLMIRGTMRMFGGAGLFLLLFYGIFFAVGFGMLGGAVMALSSEWVELSGRDLTIEYALAGFRWKRRHRLGKVRSVRIESVHSSRNGTPSSRVALLDEEGREVRFAAGLGRGAQKEVAATLAEYLGAEVDVEPIHCLH